LDLDQAYDEKQCLFECICIGLKVTVLISHSVFEAQCYGWSCSC